MASRSLTLYIGVTGHLWRRALEHKAHDYAKSFTSRYKVERLVHFEFFGEVTRAIAREKELKTWRREKKIALIKDSNPAWADLAEGWYTPAALSGNDTLENGAIPGNAGQLQIPHFVRDDTREWGVPHRHEKTRPSPLDSPRFSVSPQEVAPSKSLNE